MTQRDPLQPARRVYTPMSNRLIESREMPDIDMLWAMINDLRDRFSQSNYNKLYVELSSDQRSIVNNNVLLQILQFLWYLSNLVLNRERMRELDQKTKKND